MEKRAYAAPFRAHIDVRESRPKLTPATARRGGRHGAAEDDLDVGAAPIVQDEVREHLRAGGEGSRSAICAPCVPPLSAPHDA